LAHYDLTHVFLPFIVLSKPFPAAAAAATTRTIPSLRTIAAMTLYGRRYKIRPPGRKPHQGYLEKMLSAEAAKQKKEEKEKKRVETARVRFIRAHMNRIID
jgi:hypothetical protein